ncbi:MAG: hypothetical protein ACPLPT_00025 [Moorellales bacterium]
MLNEEDLGRQIREALQEEAEKAILPPAEEVWARIRTRISSRPPRRRFLPVLVACGLAAAVLALVLTGPWGAGRGVAPPQVALGPGSAANDGSTPSLLADREPLEATESATPFKREEAQAEARQEKLAPPSAAAETLAGSGETAASEDAKGEEPAPAAAEADRLRAHSLPSARNHQPPPRPSVSPTREEVRDQLPFALPSPTELPAGLVFSDLKVESQEQQTVATLVYRGERNYLYLRVSNGPLEGTLEPAESVTLERAVGVMSRQEQLVRLRWEQDQLFLEIESNLQPDQVLSVANSVRQPPSKPAEPSTEP